MKAYMRKMKKLRGLRNKPENKLTPSEKKYMDGKVYYRGTITAKAIGEA